MTTVSRGHGRRQPAKRKPKREALGGELEGERVLKDWQDVLLIVEHLEEDAKAGVEPARVALADIRRTLGRYTGRFKIVRQLIEGWFVEHRRMTTAPIASLLDELRASTTIRDQKHACEVVEELERAKPGTLNAYAKLLWVEPERVKYALAEVLAGSDLKEHGGKAGARMVQARLAERQIAARTVYDQEAKKTKPEMRATVFGWTFGPVAREGAVGAQLFGDAFDDPELTKAINARLSAANKNVAKK